MAAPKSEASAKRSFWPQTLPGRVALVGIVYFLIGYGSALLDPSVPDRLRFPWRLMAWVLSAVTFAAHIGHEHFRLRTAAVKTASRVAAAVAVGALLLALGATAHAFLIRPGAPIWRYFLALILWPLITAVPAFVVAFVAATLLGRVPAKRVAE